MTPIAERLIHDLRHDDHVRRHFLIHSWEGAGTCNTVGCFAGTAMFMEMGSDFLPQHAGIIRLKGYLSTKNSWHNREGARILGIPWIETAKHLFVPWDWSYALIENEGDAFLYLPENARPSLDTVQQMRDWALSSPEFPSRIKPEHAARALELIVRDEQPWCDWRRAFEEA